MRNAVLALLLAVAPASAETAVATRTIPARSILSAEDLATGGPDLAGGASIEDALGQEARVTIFAGRPVLLANLTAPALVDRNQVVRLIYRRGTLTIHAEGRALGRAAEGATVRVLNTGSRSIVAGRVLPDGAVEISTSQ